MALTDEQIAQERKAFEAVHPMPESCMWCGRGYAGTEYNAWRAHEYAALFKGWIEHAAATAPLLERIAALEAMDSVSLVVKQMQRIAALEAQVDRAEKVAYCHARDSKKPTLKDAQVEQAAQPVGFRNVGTQAMTDFEVTNSIIHACHALRLPQSFTEKLGMTAQIVALKGATYEVAEFIAEACNRHTEYLANPVRPSEAEKLLDAAGLCRRCAAPKDLK